MAGQEEFSQYSYDWNQSHDQATILLKVPYQTRVDDLTVIIDNNLVVAGIKGEVPLIKGRFYGTVLPTSSWQLEAPSRPSPRERTISTTSTASSYAFLSDPEAFANSLESTSISDMDEPMTPSTSASSPPTRERVLPAYSRRNTITRSHMLTSRDASPGEPLQLMTSSTYSSLESLHSLHGRLLTIHLEKTQSIIWPALIVGPVPQSLSPIVTNPTIYGASHELEHKYNMDPTSLSMLAVELYEIRKDTEEAFECLVRAWLQVHLPSATLKLAKDYFPVQTSFELIHVDEQAPRATAAYYVQCLGGLKGLAQLYLEAGLLHLEGAAAHLIPSSHTTLTSIRLPSRPLLDPSDAEAWRRDREAANRYFERARSLDPSLDIPVLPEDANNGPSQGDTEELEMPTIEINPGMSASFSSDSPQEENSVLRRRRRKEDSTALLNSRSMDDLDYPWYQYIPGLVGAGTALLVVGMVGALSVSSWRRNQGS